MKKLILATAAASLLAVPAVAAPNPYGQYRDAPRYEQSHQGNYYQAGRYHRSGKNWKASRNYRNWRKGDRFDRRHVSRYQVIQNPYAYQLHAAPRGYRWVQADNDIVLVAITSGIIGAIIANAF